MFKKYLEYLRDNPHGYWFKAKLYGWGWTPVKWQGWLVLMSYIVLVILLSLTIDPTSSPRKVTFIFLLPIALLTMILVGICYKKGEKLRWQWGLKKRAR